MRPLPARCAACSEREETVGPLHPGVFREGAGGSGWRALRCHGVSSVV